MLFHRVGVDTVGELLSYYPRTYDVYQEPVTFANLETERVQAVTGFVRKVPAVNKTGRYAVTTVVLEEFGAFLHLTWFNMPYLKNSLSPGSTYIFRGRVQKKKGRLVMEQPRSAGIRSWQSRILPCRPFIFR